MVSMAVGSGTVTAGTLTTPSPSVCPAGGTVAAFTSGDGVEAAGVRAAGVETVERDPAAAAAEIAERNSCATSSGIHATQKATAVSTIEARSSVPRGVGRGVPVSSGTGVEVVSL